MAEYITSGRFNNTLIIMCFILGTLYGLNYYYQGLDYGSQINSEKFQKPDGFWDSVFTSGTDWLLSILSVFSPFILIKGILFVSLRDFYGTYQAIDLFILRPVGWVILFMEAEWVINKVRAISG